MEFKIRKDFYEEGVKIFAKNKLELEMNNVYCLVGCNGIGKSSLLEAIIENLKKNNAERITTDNSCKGLQRVFEEAMGKENKEANTFYYMFNKTTETSFSFEQDVINKLMHGQQSTGENIIRRFGEGLRILGDWIRNNKDKKLFIFFDDCDAGTSIDNISEIKAIFDYIIKDCQRNNVEYCFVITSNSYEMARDLKCISVVNFKEVSFKTYEAYKKFVLKSREYKNKREDYE